jgi:hypothetical protein
MKNSTSVFSLMIAAGALFLAGCLKTESNPVSESSVAATPINGVWKPVSPEIADKLKLRGLNPDQAVERGDEIVYQGDIVFSRDKLLNPPAGARGDMAVAAQIRSKYLVGPDYQWRITVRVHQSAKEKRLQVLEAMNRWNAALMGQVLVEANSTEIPDITVYDALFGGAHLGTNVCAQASWPTERGSPGDHIFLNLLVFNGLPGMTDEAWITTIMHEMGHCLGLMHTDQPISLEGSTIPGTPAYSSTNTSPDQASIMTWIACEVEKPFSFYDKMSIRYIFPQYSLDPMTATNSTGLVATGVTGTNYFAGHFSPDRDYSTDLMVRTGAGELKYWEWSSTQWKFISKGTKRTGVNYSKYLSGDFNGDGLEDVLGVNSTNGAYLLAWNGASFAAPKQVGTLGSYTNLYAADFNCDGRTDLVGRASDNNLYWHRWTGTAFAAKVKITGSMAYSKYLVHDFTGDGCADVMGVDNAGQFYWYENNEFNGLWGRKKVNLKMPYANLMIGEVNSDGLDDVVGRLSDGTVIVQEWQGYGTFYPPLPLRTGFNFSNYFMGRLSNAYQDDVFVRKSNGDIIAYWWNYLR